MPVNRSVSLKTAARTSRAVVRLTDMAQDDLLLAISCIQCAVESDRQDLLLDCALEYVKCLEGKLKLAAKVAREAQPMPLSSNGVQGTRV